MMEKIASRHFYHVTSKKRLKTILREGLIPRGKGSGGGAFGVSGLSNPLMVYLASSTRHSLHFATGIPDPVYLRLVLSDVRRLYPDEEHLGGIVQKLGKDHPTVRRFEKLNENIFGKMFDAGWKDTSVAFKPSEVRAIWAIQQNMQSHWKESYIQGTVAHLGEIDPKFIVAVSEDGRQWKSVRGGEYKSPRGYVEPKFPMTAGRKALILALATFLMVAGAYAVKKLLAWAKTKSKVSVAHIRLAWKDKDKNKALKHLKEAATSLGDRDAAKLKILTEKLK